VNAHDLLIVLLCELGERIVTMRALLDAPAVATKPHASAVAALLTQGLDAVEERLQRDVLAPRGRMPEEESADSWAVGPATLRTLDDCGRALRALHRRLGLLDMRVSAAPVDIFLRKLRADCWDVPHPTVVLCDDYGAFADDVAAGLCAELRDAGVPVGGSWDAGTAVIALPRLEAANPLAWPLLLPALVRLQGQATDQATGDRRQATERRCRRTPNAERRTPEEATGDPLPPTASATGPGGPGPLAGRRPAVAEGHEAGRAAAASGCLLPTGGSHGCGG
jgi:hypothetical protein